MVRQIRLVSGVVLMVFVACHLLNHALGIISLDALAWGREIFLFLWRSWPGTIVLYGALLAHLVLALWSIYQRQSWRLPAQDWWLLGLGLVIPPLLITHVLANRMAHEVYGLLDTYEYNLAVYFIFDKARGWAQVLLLLVVWLHGCIGVHFWLRLKTGYAKWRAPLFALALVLPLLALFGFWTAGQTVVRLAADPTWLEDLIQRDNFPSEAQIIGIYRLSDGILTGLIGALVLTVAVREGFRFWRRRRGMLRVSYPNGQGVSVRPGTTILEASRHGAIPHTSICGGKGRCSTCRVRISQDAQLAPPSQSESKVLARIGAAPNVRLACQTPVTDHLHVVPLLPPTANLRKARSQPDYLRGEERQIAVLFADLRGFTSLSEQKLPYDVVFILNRYFESMGKAVEDAGGHLDKFIGDGVMALFGVEKGPEEGCKQALTAARLMAEQLVELNRSLAGDLESPLRIGIGIHSGTAIVGEMGYGQSISVTAVGDTVNTASRLEALTKEYGAQLVVSESLMTLAGMAESGFDRHEIEVRGRSEKLGIFVIPKAEELAL